MLALRLLAFFYLLFLLHKSACSGCISHTHIFGSLLDGAFHFVLWTFLFGRFSFVVTRSTINRYGRLVIFLSYIAFVEEEIDTIQIVHVVKLDLCILCSSHYVFIVDFHVRSQDVPKDRML